MAQQKTVGIPKSTHRKLQKIKQARRWGYSTFIDMAADRELAAIEREVASEARRTAASSDQPALAGLPQ